MVKWLRLVTDVISLLYLQTVLLESSDTMKYSRSKSYSRYWERYYYIQRKTIFLKKIAEECYILKDGLYETERIVCITKHSDSYSPSSNIWHCFLAIVLTVFNLKRALINGYRIENVLLKVREVGSSWDVAWKRQYVSDCYFGLVTACGCFKSSC